MPSVTLLSLSYSPAPEVTLVLGLGCTLFYYFNALFVFYVSILLYRNIFFMQPAAFPPLLFLRLASKPPWTEEPSRLQSMGSISVRHERLHFYFSLSCIGEGNGNPLQCSCLENPRDGGAWWAAVYGVTQSQMNKVT